MSPGTGCEHPLFMPKTAGIAVRCEDSSEALGSFAQDVRLGLGHSGQKYIPCKYFYDAVGSALFEAIALLPEYGLTRADQRILTRHADEIAAALSPPLIVAELGSGSAKKTRLLLEALARRRPTTYHPIEISPAALAVAERELGHLDGVSVRGFEAEYLDGLGHVAERRKSEERLLVLFLGSSIGNFNRDEDCEFLARIHGLLAPGDALLLGTDLVKPVARMIQAYDDPAGVTAAFNLNLLARINRELEADFNLDLFEHQALYDETAHRIEMHLRAKTAHQVRIRKAEFEVAFRAGETIWTESSHKYTLADIVRIAGETGFEAARHWLDDDWPFAETLLVAK